MTEPEAVAFRKQKRFRRKRFWAAGVMDILTFDQHDKWKRFGLWLHLGLDPYCGRLAWLKVWWCNRNPRLIASYYIEAGRKVGGVSETLFLLFFLAKHLVCRYTPRYTE